MKAWNSLHENLPNGFIHPFLTSVCFAFSALLQHGNPEENIASLSINPQAEERIQADLNKYFAMTSQAYFNVLSYTCFMQITNQEITLSMQEEFFSVCLCSSLFYFIVFAFSYAELNRLYTDIQHYSTIPST